ncbi:MAG TPA: hypothetical protein PLK99_10115 [Burkholderiales bacterium]|nr:hypothetical protein [Burkholderiales bacterium]
MKDILDIASKLNDRTHALETQQLPALLETLAEMKQKQAAFESSQLPTLLKTVSDINHRQLNHDNDQSNLIKSVPVSLRKITRDIAGLEERIGKIQDELGNTWNTQQSIQNQIGDIWKNQESTQNQIGDIWKRIEFIRQELMFEMRYGASSTSARDNAVETQTEILSPEKLAEARLTQLRLNLGCGHIPLEGYINVDRRPLPGVDIVAEVDALPFEPGDLDEIFSAHFLEHFPQEQLRRQFLPYFFSLLKDGGIFRAVVPDAEAMIREYSTGRFTYENLREVMYGGQDYDGDFHFNMFTPDSLSGLLAEAKFTNVEIVDRGRRNGACLEFEISANRPIQVRV